MRRHSDFPTSAWPDSSPWTTGSTDREMVYRHSSVPSAARGSRNYRSQHRHHAIKRRGQFLGQATMFDRTSSSRRAEGRGIALWASTEKESNGQGPTDEIKKREERDPESYCEEGIWAAAWKALSPPKPSSDR